VVVDIDLRQLEGECNWGNWGMNRPQGGEVYPLLKDAILREKSKREGIGEISRSDSVQFFLYFDVKLNMRGEYDEGEVLRNLGMERVWLGSVVKIIEYVV
jgi:hypothetical protein